MKHVLRHKHHCMVILLWVGVVALLSGSGSGTTTTTSPFAAVAAFTTTTRLSRSGSIVKKKTTNDGTGSRSSHIIHPIADGANNRIRMHRSSFRNSQIGCSVNGHDTLTTATTEVGPAPSLQQPEVLQIITNIQDMMLKMETQMETQRNALETLQSKMDEIFEAGLAGQNDMTPQEQTLAMIDPEYNNIPGVIVDDDDGEPYDARLELVDPVQNIDKYYVLQLIQTSNTASSSSSSSLQEFMVYQRWGRVWGKGALVQEFDDLAAAEKCFKDKFKQKTGLAWDERHTSPAIVDKYRFVPQVDDNNEEIEEDSTSPVNAESSTEYGGAKWEYWVDDKVQGKADGWYDYDDEASNLVENLFYEHVKNPELSQCIVKSGIFEYLVDVNTMTQTNTETKKSRRIRRFPIGGSNDEDEEEDSTAHVNADSWTEDSGAKWEYYVDDKVDGKADGWYDYHEAASKQVEQRFLEHVTNPELSHCIVQSGIYEYLVDINTMTQTNSKTKTSRRIRRCLIVGINKTAASPTSHSS